MKFSSMNTLLGAAMVLSSVTGTVGESPPDTGVSVWNSGASRDGGAIPVRADAGISPEAIWNSGVSRGGGATPFGGGGGFGGACPTGSLWGGAGQYCMGGALYNCQYPGSRATLLSTCSGGFCQQQQRSVPDRCVPNTGGGVWPPATRPPVGGGSSWVPESILNGRRCSSTYMASGNTIKCNDGTTWTDDGRGNVRMTSGSNPWPTWPQRPSTSWPSTSWWPQRPSGNQIWVPEAVLRGRQCTSTYMASGNTITCSDGTTWTDDGRGNVRRTSSSMAPVTNNPWLSANANWRASEKLPTPGLVAGSTSSSLVGGGLGPWLPHSILDDKGCMSTYAMQDNVINCADGSMWTDRLVNGVRMVQRVNNA